jgi:molybdopterin synthase catalytic subunit
VRRVAIVHRLGKLDLSESSVVVAVGSEHREEAFLGAKYAIDSLKVKAPIWKKETWSGGEDWSSVATTIID